MEYKIPEEILAKVPQYFLPAFAGELVCVFGLAVFEKSETDSYGLFYVSSTLGWNAALRMTCNKLDMKWLFDYYDKLEWWQSDMFDGEIEDRLISIFVEAKGSPWNDYYQWLIRSSS